MAQPCADGDLCRNFNCRDAHPPSWWKCDYASLCFVAGCEGIHPELCKQTPCRNIKNCNLMHTQACQYGSTCNNSACQNLHPPPCANPNCNGAGCLFTHPFQPKYDSVITFSHQPKGNQIKHTGNATGVSNRNAGGFSNAGAAPSAGWDTGSGNTRNQNFNSPPPAARPPKSEQMCRYGERCTRGADCEFKH